MTDRHFIFLTIGIPVSIVALIVYFEMNYWGPQRAREYQFMVYGCASRGGVILDHTYTVGSGKNETTKHSYTCIDKSVVIEPETNL